MKPYLKHLIRGILDGTLGILKLQSESLLGKLIPAIITSDGEKHTAKDTGSINFEPCKPSTWPTSEIESFN